MDGSEDAPPTEHPPLTELAFRPAAIADIDRFERTFVDAERAGEYQWFGFTSLEALRREVLARGLLGGESNMLIVTIADQMCGRVEWMERRWGRRDTSMCWEIAVAILPEFRGRGYGSRAQVMLVDYLFSHTRVERLQATTDPQNIAEQKCLDRAGFTLEGTVRRAQWRQGRWHDQLLYSILRPEAQGSV